MRLKERGRYAVSFVPDQPYEISLSVEDRTNGALFVNFCGHMLTVDFNKGRILADAQEIWFDRCRVLDIDILVDYAVIEFRAQQDTLYYVYENEQESLSGAIEVLSENGVEGIISVFDIK